jgi:integrase
MANIDKRGKNSYRVTVSGGFDGDGNRILFRHTVNVAPSFGSPDSQAYQRELNRLVSLYIADVERGTATNLENIKLRKFVNDVWMPLHVMRKNLAPKTVWRYKQLLSRILFSLGNNRLKNLKPKHIMEFLTNLKEKNIRINKDPEKAKIPLSDQTVVHHYRLLHSILEKAKEWQYITINPATIVERPKVMRTRKKVFSHDNIIKLKEALEKRSIRDQVMVLLTLATGARLGEVLGLTWDRVSTETGTIRIEESYQYTPDTGRTTKLPKNESSIRDVTLPASILKLIMQWKVEQGEKRLFMGEARKDQTNAVFTTYLTTRMTPNTVSTWFPKWVEEIGLPRVTFHGLRHTAASLLIAYGASPAEVARLLGHSTVGTTMNIYVHDFDDASKNMSDKMESILFDERPKTTKRSQK